VNRVTAAALRNRSRITHRRGVSSVYQYPNAAIVKREFVLAYGAPGQRAVRLGGSPDERDEVSGVDSSALRLGGRRRSVWAGGDLKFDLIPIPSDSF